MHNLVSVADVGLKDTIEFSLPAAFQWVVAHSGAKVLRNHGASYWGLFLTLWSGSPGIAEQLNMPIPDLRIPGDACNLE